MTKCDTSKQMPHRSHPCEECPWKRDTQPGQFPAERYEALRNTSGTRGNEAHFGAPMFACHKSQEGRDVPCAGWLAAVGYESITVRVLVMQGRLPAEALTPGEGWPELFRNYAEMEQHQARRARKGRKR